MVRAEARCDPLLEPMRLTRVEEWVVSRSSPAQIAARRRNFLRLAEEFRDRQEAAPVLPGLPPGAAPYVFPVRVAAPDAVYADLRAAGAPVLRWDRFWPGAIEAGDDLGRQWGNDLLQILCHQDLTPDDMTVVARALIEASQRHRACSPQSVATDGAGGEVTLTQ
jgi:hypothetical protein